MQNTLDLLLHMHWADATVWSALLDTPLVSEDERLRKFCYHIHMVQRAFLRLWNDPGMELPKYEEFPSLALLACWAREYHTLLAPYLEAVTEEQMRGVVAVPWSRYMEQRSGRKVEDSTLGETMLQVVMHSSYHRGQVNARLRELGADPPIVDYIAWIWLGRPSAEWPGQGSGAAA
jgi:uncharacterized damage-inducible protein DinB